MMKKLGMLVVVGLGSVLLGAGSCENPCAKLPPPNAAQLGAAAAGAEVELEVGYAECVVDPNSKTWVYDGRSS